jgi:hypothetical protein
MVRLLLALLMLGVTIALAQDEEAAPVTPETSAEAQEAPASDSEARPRRDESPFDYEASEQISEDLSVSFPVDI